MDRLSAAMARVLADPAIKGRLDGNGMPPMLGYTPARFNAFMDEERAFWPPIVRASGAPVQ